MARRNKVVGVLIELLPLLDGGEHDVEVAIAHEHLGAAAPVRQGVIENLLVELIVELILVDAPNREVVLAGEELDGGIGQVKVLKVDVSILDLGNYLILRVYVGDLTEHLLLDAAEDELREVGACDVTLECHAFLVFAVLVLDGRAQELDVVDLIIVGLCGLDGLGEQVVLRPPLGAAL